MARKRAREPQAPVHLIEPLHPTAVPLARRNTPGYIARLLEVYRRGHSAKRTAFRTPFPGIDTRASNHASHSNMHSQPPISPMDALANTALSNGPAFGQYYSHSSQAAASAQVPSQWSPGYYSGAATHPDYVPGKLDGRPFKRARSEALSSPLQQPSNSRPTTGHRESSGTQHNVEHGINNLSRKRQLSQAERDILDFMESLKSKRHEGSADLCLKESASPAPPFEELPFQADGDTPVAVTKSQESTSSSGASELPHSGDRRMIVMRAEMDHKLRAAAFDDFEDLLKQPSVPTAQTQTQTPPGEKEVTPLSVPPVADTSLSGDPFSHELSNEKAKTPKTKAAGPRRTYKTTGKHKGSQPPDAPHQLHSPQSLPTESSDPRASDLMNAGSNNSVPRADLPPRPRSAQDAALPESFSPEPPAVSQRSASVPPTTPMVIYPGAPLSAPVPKRPGRPRKLKQDTVCASCHFSPNSLMGETESWLQCNGCKAWYHFACAGFKNEREVRDVDKFYCKQCTPKFGKTTRVRKSARAHNSVDYAKLTEGIVQTSDETVEHHYIKPIKNGDIDFTPETFPRMPPELVTAEYFERCRALTEPVVIPAAWNPRPGFPGSSDTNTADSLHNDGDIEMGDAFDETDSPMERVEDVGQDQLGMVIPYGLTVRRVAELYGLQEKLEVIDVKSQEGEDKRWTLAKWADYYEDQSEDKPVRNVISLEVSRTRLGNLIRRPQIVRDLDLADSVWMEKGHPPKVQFYILMSVADCFTDFHIDFGGSSVYYHIIKGSKTFFFIPPTTANLKHYENWCKSQAQNYCWLGNQTKECYRVDLSEGDTMLIPSGWIHAVWTPSDSLVVGGNFLTRLNYTNQIKVLEIEKSTKVPLRFRYPYFQKVMWFTVLQYLAQDPLPAHIEVLLQQGGQFAREHPVYQDYNKFGHNSDPGIENYNARYYPQAEIDGLPDLLSYIFRTVMIMLGRVEGVTVEQQNAVTKSIPKDPVEHGNPLENARKFAMWVAWKRGNEQIPEWAHTEAVLPERPESDDKSKKLSAAALKKLERAKHIEMYHTINADKLSQRASAQASRGTSPTTIMANGVKVPYASPKNSVLGPKRSACDACRKRRVGCKHKEAVRDASMVNGQRQFEFVAPSAKSQPSDKDGEFDTSTIDPALEVYNNPGPTSSVELLLSAPLPPNPPSDPVVDASPTDMAPLYERYDQWNATPTRPAPSTNIIAPLSANASRNKACATCRKSKRKCLHDENGNLDPVKVAESKQPRATAKKRASDGSGSMSSAKKIKTERLATPYPATDDSVIHVNGDIAPGLYNMPAPAAPAALPLAPVAPVVHMLARSAEHSESHSHSHLQPSSSISNFRQALLGIQSPPDASHVHHQNQEAMHQSNPYLNGYGNHMLKDEDPPPAFDNFSAPFEHGSPHHRHLQALPGHHPYAASAHHPGESTNNAFANNEIPLDPSLEAMAVQAMSAAHSSHSAADMGVPFAPTVKAPPPEDVVLTELDEIHDTIEEDAKGQLMII